MKLHNLLLISLIPALHAKSPELDLIVKEPVNEPWIKPLVDLRLRYEIAEIDAAGVNSATALTIRERLGLETKEWFGFSALVEGEFTQSLANDYNAGAGAAPINAGRALIPDPRTNELNRAQIQYSGYDTVVRLGRQRIVYDKAAFIGNVIWRQNEQTYDAASITGSWIDSLTVNYAYVGQVNRIFGSEANANFDYTESDTHLLNLSYTCIEGMKIGGYAYLMDFQDKQNWNNNTYGISASKSLGGIDFYGEVAWQDKAGFASNSDAFYAHGKATKAFDKHALTIGFESLGAGFKTPLATLHAFNGYSDVLLLGRSEGTHNGLMDTYVSYAMPIFYGMKWVNTLHAFGDNEVSTGYGWEVNSVLVKKFNKNFKGIAKAAYFDTEGDAYVGAASLPGTTRFSVELNYVF